MGGSIIEVDSSEGVGGKNDEIKNLEAWTAALSILLFKIHCAVIKTGAEPWWK